MNLQWKAPAILLALALALAVPASSPAATPAPQPAAAVETVIIFRHAEKPEGGLGQLTPQGLNRALALSTLLPRKFGRPDFLFAPDPNEKVTDGSDTSYNYIRPLATIEPTAITLEMPVQTPCGYRDTDVLINELCKPEYGHATIFIAWEHGYAQKFTADLFKKFGGETSEVPQWPEKDFDSLYIVTITRAPDHAATATFVHDHEGLDGQSTRMPTPAPK